MDQKTIKDIQTKLLEDLIELQFPGQLMVGDICVTFSDDIVENIIQEWVEGWLQKNGIDYALNDNTQMPPDFYLNPDNKKEGLMEIKAFNYKCGPGFDIADFRMYEQEIAHKPWMLDVTYLIFGYEMSEDGTVTIKKIWKNKVWEMSRPMASGPKKTIWPINLQIKKGTVHKIRPAKWYGKSTKFSIFACKEDFLAAMEETVYKNKDTRDDGPEWLSTVIKNYENHFGEKLCIPRWNDIKNKYVNDKS